MNLPAHIEQKLRRWGRKKNLSEVEIIHVQELLIKLAEIEMKEVKTQKLKIAA